MQNLTNLPVDSIDIKVKDVEIKGTGSVAKSLGLGVLGTGLLYLGNKTKNPFMEFLGAVVIIAAIVEAVK